MPSDVANDLIEGQNTTRFEVVESDANGRVFIAA